MPLSLVYPIFDTCFSVLLRQNPHNVDEWHKRVALYEGNAAQMVKTYTEAIKTVSHQHAVGQITSLWVEFAKLYEQNGDLAQARSVFDKAIMEPFRKVRPIYMSSDDLIALLD